MNHEGVPATLFWGVKRSIFGVPGWGPGVPTSGSGSQTPHFGGRCGHKCIHYGVSWGRIPVGNDGGSKRVLGITPLRRCIRGVPRPPILGGKKGPFWGPPESRPPPGGLKYPYFGGSQHPFWGMRPQGFIPVHPKGGL